MSFPKLRADLIRVEDAVHPRRVKVIDAVAGRIVRLARRDLETLAGDTGSGERTRDSGLLAGAAAAGLLRERRGRAVAGRPPTAGNGLLGWLCIRIPLVTVDPIAKSLAPRCGILFHPAVMLVGMFAALLAAGSLLAGWERAVDSAARLRLWNETSPAGWMLLLVGFVAIKAVHELAHAVACRRAGAACGEVGVFLFAGFPCPYCDVSMINRVDSAVRRAGVMLAGIYVELLLASVAAVVWWIAEPGPLQALAMNVMIVCGISTLLFNANPLMRLDGYYVLADVLGTPNLRGRAAAAWHGLITARLSGDRARRSSASIREFGFAAYHAASLAYRLVILGAILWMILRLSDSFGLLPIGIFLTVAAFVPLVLSLGMKVRNIAEGHGTWAGASQFRRRLFLAASAAVVVGVFFVPLRRELVVVGIIDVDGAVPVHAGQSGWVVAVHRDLGDWVDAGEPLVELDSPELRLELVAWDSRRRMADLQSAALRRSALREDSPDAAWRVDEANRRLVQTQWQSLTERRERLVVRAPAGGVLLPPRAMRESGDTARDNVIRSEPMTLAQRLAGSRLNDDAEVCRIGDPERRCVTLFIDARHRRHLHAGQPVRIIIDFGMPRTVESKIESISEIESSRGGQMVWKESAGSFFVRCPLPADVPDGSNPPIGAAVEAKIFVESETLVRRIARLWREAADG